MSSSTILLNKLEVNQIVLTLWYNIPWYNKFEVRYKSSITHNVPPFTKAPHNSKEKASHGTAAARGIIVLFEKSNTDASINNLRSAKGCNPDYHKPWF